MKRMSIVKKLILFISVIVIITGIYGGGYYFINYAASAKATNNVTNESNPKLKSAVVNGDSSKKNITLNAAGEKTGKNDADAYDAEEASQISNGKYIADGKKIAFLTFDDGPSTTVTPQILDTLNRYGVKATFFLIGKMIETSQESRNVVKEIYENGHAIGNHTYSHEYRIRVQGSLYYGNKVNVDQYMEELDKTDDLIGQCVGHIFKTKITRMPGGHMSREYYHDPNLQLFDEKLQERNIVNIDWNAYDQDADGKWKNSDQIFQEAKDSIGNQEKIVLLMHDAYGKEETAKALPRIIDYLKAQGYEFKKIS